ncbi:hypothetical protein [Acetobacter orientalis]|uniref:hypothetical protein n=1 Tax=Acetobacter orientalis TaxID=146474 RepID=UPI0039EA4A89
MRQITLEEYNSLSTLEQNWIKSHDINVISPIKTVSLGISIGTPSHDIEPDEVPVAPKPTAELEKTFDPDVIDAMKDGEFIPAVRLRMPERTEEEIERIWATIRIQLWKGQTPIVERGGKTVGGNEKFSAAIYFNSYIGHKANQHASLKKTVRFYNDVATWFKEANRATRNQHCRAWRDQFKKTVKEAIKTYKPEQVLIGNIGESNVKGKGRTNDDYTAIAILRTGETYSVMYAKAKWYYVFEIEAFAPRQRNGSILVADGQYTRHLQKLPIWGG